VVGAILLPLFSVRREPVLNVRLAPVAGNRSENDGGWNKNSGDGKDEMTNQYHLTKDEIEICRQMGKPIEKYVAARAPGLLREIPITTTRQERALAVQRAGGSPVRVHGLSPVLENMVTFARTRDTRNIRSALASLTDAAAKAAAVFLTPAQLEICHRTLTDPVKFALQSRQTTAGAVIEMAMHATHDGHVAPLPADMDAPACLKMAMDDITTFLADPDHLDSLQHLVSASAWLREALKMTGTADSRARGWQSRQSSMLVVRDNYSTGMAPAFTERQFGRR
jgi:hypothetical protein